jgi:hypothetical protein
VTFLQQFVLLLFAKLRRHNVLPNFRTQKCCQLLDTLLSNGGLAWSKKLLHCCQFLYFSHLVISLNFGISKKLKIQKFGIFTEPESYHSLGYARINPIICSKPNDISNWETQSAQLSKKLWWKLHGGAKLLKIKSTKNQIPYKDYRSPWWITPNWCNGFTIKCNIRYKLE